jgi:WD40 repeat protein
MCLTLGVFLIAGPVEAGEPPLKWRYLVESGVQSVSVSENGFIGLGSEHSIYLLSEDGSLLWEESLGVPVERVSMSNNGQYILAGADKFIYKFDKGKLITDKIRVWSLPTNFSFHDISVSLRGFSTIAATAADSLFGTTEDAAYVKNSAIESDYNEYTSNGKVYDVSISEEGDYIALVSSKKAQLRNREKIIWSKDIRNAYTGYVSISPDGRYVAVGFDRRLDFLDQDGRILWSLDVRGLWDVSISENGEYVAVGLANQVWFLNKEGELLWSFQIDSRGYVGSISVSSNGRYVVAASERGVYFFENPPLIVVLANSIDHSAGENFFTYLQDIGINLVHASAHEFDQFKDYDFIVILGGPDAYDGVGGVVQEVLTEFEADVIRAPGSIEIILKKDVWSHGQIVAVIAGPGRNQTKEAGEEKKEELAKVWMKGVLSSGL